MANPIEYIVFEPDQVLTNDHLNETFNYLDQQNRWTRNKLIGIGIVCGLDIILNPGIIEITKGCGVTSQGYLITQDTNQYTYYMPYTAVDVPVDLPFTYNNGDLPFFKPFCTNKSVWLLLTDDQFNSLESAQQLNAKTLSSAAVTFLSDYVIALFLEIKETDLKNCDTQDCNNKGEKMVLQVRPLLVAKNDLYNNANKVSNIDRIGIINKISPISPRFNIPSKALQLSLNSKIQLKRFNVPYTDLETTDDVLNAFVNLVDDTTLSRLTDAYNSCYQQYGAILNITSNPFSDMLAVLKNYLDQLLKQNPLAIEYFYDFIDDLIKAYDEFTAKVSHIIATGSPDENLFPLHLILGDASLATNDYIKDSYRNYFIYSPLFSKMGVESAEVLLLFSRMVLMIKDFVIPDTTQSDKFTVKITPSQYMHFPLSERAIPYYYTVNESGAELYKSWNYAKTNSGKATLNLGYNSGLYNTSTEVAQPLLYDIEKYNFFRVEGHIGQNYQDVLSNILIQRLTYNLPFDVVTVGVERFNFDDITLPDAEIRDLETDYNLITTEATIKVLTPFIFVANLPYASKTTGTNIPGKLTVDTNNPVRRVSDVKSNISRGTESISPSNTNYVYKKGTFIHNNCAVLPNTIASAYLNALSDTGVFTNPVTSPQPGSVDELYFYFFNFIDAIETVMVYLMNNPSIIDVNVNDQYDAFNNYQDSINKVIATLKGPVARTQVTRDTSMISLIQIYGLDLLIVDFETVLNAALDELLYSLSNEVNNRYSRYADKHTFLDYYKNNPGLEHKGGVPKGGTLVLVYKNYIPTLKRNVNVPLSKAANLTSVKERSASTEAVSSEEQKVSPNLDENTLNLVKKMVTDSKGVSDTEKMRLIDILAGRGVSEDEPSYDINNRLIIADFYVPYIGSPVERTTAEITPPPPPAPVISMSGTTFCDNDFNPAQIAVTIPGGTFNAVPGLDGVKQTFIPAIAKAGTYRIIYTVNNVSSAPLDVTVLSVPSNSTFSFINDWSGGVKTAATAVAAARPGIVSATFTPTIRDSRFTYDWEVFGDNISKGAVGTDGVIRISGDSSVVNVKASIVTVSLSISNGTCHSTTTSMQLEIISTGFMIITSDDGPQASLKKPGAIEKLFTKKKKDQ